MWSNLLSACLGIWLMCSPSLLGYTGLARPHDWIAGPIIASNSLIACWEITRSLRWVNTCAGLWLCLAPWILRYEDSTAMVNSLLVGLAIIALSLVRGRRTHAYGGGWASLFKRTDDRGHILQTSPHRKDG